MVRPGRESLSELVEVDETLVGGIERGDGRRHVGSNAVVVIAAEVRGSAIGRIRMQQIPDFSADSLLSFVAAAVAPGTQVITDGLQSYRGLSERGYRHDHRAALGSGDAAEAVLPRTCTALPPYSNAGGWGSTMARSVGSISITTSTSSPSAFNRRTRITAACCSTASCSRRCWSTRYPTMPWPKASAGVNELPTTTCSGHWNEGHITDDAGRDAGPGSQ